MALRTDRLALAFIVLSIFTYAGTLEVGVRIFPAEVFFLVFLFFGVNSWWPWVKTMPAREFMLLLILGSFGILAFASLWRGIPGGNIGGGIKELARYFVCVTSFVITSGWMRISRTNLEAAKRWFVYSSNLVSVYGIYQAAMCGLFGFYYPLLPGSSDVPNMNGRAVGTFFEGGYMSLYVGSAILILHRDATIFRRRIYLVSLILNVVALLASQSTAGILALVVAYLYIHIEFKISPKVIFAALASAASLAGGYWVFRDKIDASFRFFSTMDYGLLQGGLGSASAADRITKILKAINMFVENPLLGVGIGQYSWLYDNYMPLSLTTDIGSVVPLNVFVQILAENGLFGFLMMGGATLYVSRFMDKHLRGLLLFLLLSLNFYPTYKYLFIWILLSIMVRSSLLQVAAKNRDELASRPPL